MMMIKRLLLTLAFVTLFLFGILVGLGQAQVSYPTAYHDIIRWGFAGLDRASQWVGWEGRVSFINHIDEESTALDVWPTTGTLPTAHSIAELTLHRRLPWNDPCVERLNLSAMTDNADGGAYRLGMEHGDSTSCAGIAQKPLIVCFDTATPGGQSNCRLKVAPDGVYVKDDNDTWREITQ